MDQQSFDLAVDLMKVEDYPAARRAFAKLMSTTDEHDEQYNRLSSYLGLTQVLTGDNDGLLLCRDAASNELVDGQVYLNLACAEWHALNRRRSIDAIQRGIKIDADNQRLTTACAKFDCRKKCCFGFLSRGHRLNRLFGRLRRRPNENITVHSLLFPS